MPDLLLWSLAKSPAAGERKTSVPNQIILQVQLW